jgi:hypothetical protein
MVFTLHTILSYTRTIATNSEAITPVTLSMPRREDEEASVGLGMGEEGAERVERPALAIPAPFVDAPKGLATCVGWAGVASDAVGLPRGEVLAAVIDDAAAALLLTRCGMRVSDTLAGLELTGTHVS